MKEKIIKYLPYALLTIVCIVYARSCSVNKSEVTQLNKAWKFKEFMYTNNERTLKRTVDEQGNKITSQEQLMVTKDSELAESLIENQRLKDIKSEVKIITKTVIKEVYVPFETTVYDTLSGDSAKPFNKEDKWYSFSGMVLKNGVRMDSIKFIDETTVTIGSEKKNMFKKRIPTVDIVNKNPYSTTTEAYNVIIVPPKKKFLETTAGKVLIGVAGGILLSTQL